MGSCAGQPQASETILNHGDWLDLIWWQPRPDAPNDNNFHAVAIRGILDETRLREAVDGLQARHPRMRAKLYMNPLTSHTYLLETKERIPVVVRDGSYLTINTDLERILMRPIDTAIGPFCHITYIRHLSEGTGLLVFGNNHGVTDGRGCEMVLSQLLKLYDGQDVPFSKNTKGMLQLVTAPNAEKLKAWQQIEDCMPARHTNTILETFVEPGHPSYEAKFEGICLELLRLEAPEAKRLLEVCRREKTTVTGAVAAAAQYAVLAELLRRGRTTEFVMVGTDMNLRGRQLGPEYDQECGNFVYASSLRVGFETEFWAAARKFTCLIKQTLDQDCGLASMFAGYGDMVSKEGLMLMKSIGNEAQAVAGESMEHINFSSLGVLKRFGSYTDFEVLENFTASNIGFGASKCNLCTSGSSGRLTITFMVARNVVPHARQAACQLRDHAGCTLNGIMAPEDSEEHRAALQACSAAALGMQDAAKQRIEKRQALKQAGHKVSFPGDTSGQNSCTTHIKVLLNVFCSILATGVLAGWPLVSPVLKEVGVFNYVCDAQEETCNAQAAVLASLYQYSMYISLLLTMVCGGLFDFVGPKASGVGGAMASCVSMLGIGLTITLDAKTYPWSQFSLMYLFCSVADMGGFAASMAIMGWLWHYPRSQSFLIGLSNGCVSSASAMGLFVPLMVEYGFSASSSFMLLSMLAALAAIGLFVATPPQSELYKQAAKVLNVPASSVKAQKPNWWGLKLGLKSLWSILCVFPMLNFLVCLALGCGTMGYMRWISSSGEKYRLWFNENEFEELEWLFATIVPVFSIVLNPVAGFIMDYLGLARYILIVISATAGMSVSEPIPTFDAQQVFMWLFAVYLGTVQNIIGRWPLYFVPPHLFGVTYGFMSAMGGIFGLILNPPLDAMGLTGDGPTCVLMTSCSVALGVVGVVLLVRGLPKRPPRTRFDTEAYCMNDASALKFD